MLSSRVEPLASRTRATIGATTGAKLGGSRRLLLCTGAAAAAAAGLLLFATGTAGFRSGVAAVKVRGLASLLAFRTSVALRIASKDFAKPNDIRAVGEAGELPPLSPPPSVLTHGGRRLKEGVGLIPETREIREIRDIRDIRETREEAWCGEGEGQTES